MVGLGEFSVGLDVAKVSRVDVEDVVGSAVSAVDSWIDSVVEASKFLVDRISCNSVVKAASVLGNVTIHVGCTVSVCMATAVTKGDDLGRGDTWKPGLAETEKALDIPRIRSL